ncbi:MAG: hypothetical protein H7Y13_03065 [Sphingobacteriaceae bacterium]|nr:hypothetical protein [Sphingobacteriaceae bacterium]
MNTKLTLNVDKAIIEHAKTYAKQHRVSLSKLIENYLNSLTPESGKKPKISPLVESLTGVIPRETADFQKDYQDYLSKKHQ